MKILIIEQDDHRLMMMGNSGYFRHVELKTGNFKRDPEYNKFVKKLYGCNICFRVNDGIYKMYKAHTKSGYYMDRIVAGKNNYTEKQVMRMFGKWIDKNTKFKMSEKARAHYEKYAEFCPQEIARMYR